MLSFSRARFVLFLPLPLFLFLCSINANVAHRHDIPAPPPPSPGDIESNTNAEYTITKLRRARDVGERAPSALRISSNVLRLKRAGGSGVASSSASSLSRSAKLVRAMREKEYRERRRRSEIVERGLTNGMTPLQSVEGGHVFLVDVVVGGQSFPMVIDTGSSDPWLVNEGFECYDARDGSSQSQAYCGFGPAYDASYSQTYQAVAGQNFTISYADGEHLTGTLGRETFLMARISVPNQQFGLVDTAAWLGDGVSAGLVGFAYRTLTSAYAGDSPAADQKGQTELYNPLFVNMYTDQAVAPVFTLAIDRNPDIGGLLALGGIPDVPHVPNFVSTPIHPVAVNSSDGEPVYEFYTIDVDGFAYSDDDSTQFNPFGNANPRKTALVGKGTNMIVDSGTSLIYVPDDIADAIAALYDPPATWDDSTAAYHVACGAKPPIFGVAIRNKIFYVNGADLVVRIAGSLCVTGVQPSLGGVDLLGATWMKNVLAVFDIGAEQMRFAARPSYSTSEA